jgi:PAS domain S-box-containing protein
MKEKIKKKVLPAPDERSDNEMISCSSKQDSRNNSANKSDSIENIFSESEERFRQFAENTSDAFILSSLEKVLYVNPAFQSIFGKSVFDKPIDHVPIEWVHPDDREKLNAVFNSAEFLKTKKFNGQYRIINSKGIITWIWERSFPVNNKNGEVFRYIFVASDITRQKQLESDIIKTKTQQQAIIDNIPHHAWLKDVDGKYVCVNEAFAKHYHYTKEDLIGKTDSDFCHPDLAELYAYNDYIVLNTKKQQQFDEFVDTPEGTIYTEIIKTPVINSENEVIGIAGISRDITYYKRLEQQLRSNDDRLKALLRNSNDSITVIEKDGRIIFDTSFHMMVDDFSQGIVGTSFFDYIVEQDKPFIAEAIAQVLQYPGVQRCVDFSIRKADGSKSYFESYFSNHLKNPLIKGIVLNIRDITERKVAEIKEKEYQDNLVFLESTALQFLSLSTSEEIYDYIGKMIFELVPDSVSIFSSFDESSNSLIIQNITGVDKYQSIIQDFLGQSPIHYQSELTPQMQRNLFSKSNKLHMLSGGLYNIFKRQIDYVVCKALEKLISMNKAYGMGIVRGHKLFGSLVVLTRYSHDVKDTRIVETLMYQASIALQRKYMEQQYIEAKEKAEESDRLKTAFLANMSHEIRTPVNGIIGFSQLLQDESITDDKRLEYTEIIKANADSLISLIDDILDISRIQEGQIKLRKTTVNINLILDEVYSNYTAPKFKERAIAFEISKSLPDESATLTTDPLRVKQIFNNLISNAFKFTEKGKIEVGYTIEPGFIRCFVSDTGIGISPEKVNCIFQRFIQEDISYTRKFSGNGLGLAISKGFVDLLGGSIWVESVLNEGSTFYFTLPTNDVYWKKPDTLAESAKTNPSLLN